MYLTKSSLYAENIPAIRIFKNTFLEELISYL